MNAQNNRYYFALSGDCQGGNRNFSAFKTYISDLMEQPLIKEQVETFQLHRHRLRAEKHGEFLPWNALLVMELKSQAAGVTLAEFLSSQKLPEYFALIRMETLVTTPESTFPARQPNPRRLKPIYAVEYVDVAQAHLDEFRDIMISNNGPAMAYIIENRRWCSEFLALEFCEIHFHNTDYPGWNQLHVIALYAGAFIRYKKDFSAGLQRASGISFEDNFHRLKEIRRMLYKSLGRRLV